LKVSAEEQNALYAHHLGLATPGRESARARASSHAPNLKPVSTARPSERTPQLKGASSVRRHTRIALAPLHSRFATPRLAPSPTNGRRAQSIRTGLSCCSSAATCSGRAGTS
jgi:hypothetical protein